LKGLRFGFYEAVIVIGGEVAGSQQDIGDRWRLAHWHDGVLWRAFPFRIQAVKQLDREPGAMTQING
jgi:hypothetical protein